MLLLTINRKPYMESQMTSSLLTLNDLERSKSRSRSLGFSVEGDLRRIDMLASCYITTLIWMSQKVVCWRVGFSTVPVVFLVIIHTGSNISLNTITTHLYCCKEIPKGNKFNQ